VNYAHKKVVVVDCCFPFLSLSFWRNQEKKCKVRLSLWLHSQIPRNVLARVTMYVNLYWVIILDLKISTLWSLYSSFYKLHLIKHFQSKDTALGYWQIVLNRSLSAYLVESRTLRWNRQTPLRTNCIPTSAGCARILMYTLQLFRRLLIYIDSRSVANNNISTE
jgi:hypothetical protein